MRVFISQMLQPFSISGGLDDLGDSVWIWRDRKSVTKISMIPKTPPKVPMLLSSNRSKEVLLESMTDVNNYCEEKISKT